jgi:2-succinyl-6-hydroxy-2,4-cyclohexadiene-1-carboxylate synthase
MRGSILALHGFWGSPGDFAQLKKNMNAEWCWKTPALPGHDGTPLPPEGAQLPALATWCIDHLASLHAGKPRILMGYSLGARIALSAAVENPEAITALILLSGSPGLPNAAERKMRARLDEKRARVLQACLTQNQLEAFLREWWNQPLFRSPAWKESLFAPFLADRLQQDPGALATILRQASPGLQDPLWERLPQVSCPTLCVAGSADKKFSFLARTMAEQIPNGQALVIPATGHSLLLENPAGLASVLQKWLAEPEKFVAAP